MSTDNTTTTTVQPIQSVAQRTPPVVESTLPPPPPTTTPLTVEPTGPVSSSTTTTTTPVTTTAAGAPFVTPVPTGAAVTPTTSGAAIAPTTTGAAVAHTTTGAAIAPGTTVHPTTGAATPLAAGTTAAATAAVAEHQHGHNHTEVGKCIHHDAEGNPQSWRVTATSAHPATAPAAADRLHFDTHGEAIHPANDVREGNDSAATLHHADEQQRHQAEKQMEKEVLKGSDAGILNKAKAAVNVVSHSVAATYHGMRAGKDTEQHQMAGVPDPALANHTTPTPTTTAEVPSNTTTPNTTTQV